jgi:hypothetical protein
VYVPEQLVPELEQALANGRALQELVLALGVRYTRARKAELTSQSGAAQKRSRRQEA